jgi:seryl-tRNA synthetase
VSHRSPKRFYDGLVASGLIIPVGTPGIFGRNAVFEDVLRRFDDYVTRIAATDGAEKMLFPPTLDRKVLEKSEFLHSFPHLAGVVFSFVGNDKDHAELRARLGTDAPWGDLESMTDVVLTPAACYPVYPTFRGTVPEAGRLVDMQNWVTPIISDEGPTAVCSFNWHEEHFGKIFEIRTPDGAFASTACLGFGMERVCMALFSTHGFDPTTWPRAVRELLWP